MSVEQVEVIDSSQMTVLSEFDAVGDIVDSTYRFRLGIYNDEFIINTKSGSGRWFGGVFFERTNLAAVTQALDDLQSGRAAQRGELMERVKVGKDKVLISAHAPRGLWHVSIQNNRPAHFDTMEFNGYSINMNPETATRLRDELLNIVQRNLA